MARLTHTLIGRAAKEADFARLAEFPWSRVDLEGFPVPIYVCFGAVGERVAITGLMLSPGVNREIKARALRDIPLSRLLLLSKVSLIPGFVKKSEPYRPRLKPGPKGWPRDHFEKIAASYRRALKTHPRTPVRALVGQLGVSEATVHRWLQRCRDMGLLT